jgi:hypothetical protein
VLLTVSPLDLGDERICVAVPFGNDAAARLASLGESKPKALAFAALNDGDADVTSSADSVVEKSKAQKSSSAPPTKIKKRVSKKGK